MYVVVVALIVVETLRCETGASGLGSLGTGALAGYQPQDVDGPV